MALQGEWRKRIDDWRRKIKALWYRPLGAVEMAGFVTQEQLTPGQAAAGQFGEMPVGTPWGGKWDYAWFRGEVVVPEDAAGERIALDFGGGGIEALIFVDGKAVGSKSSVRMPIVLAEQARAGESFSVLVEAYADHGPRLGAVGPVFHGEPAIPEPPEHQQCVSETTFGIWEEEAFQLWLDMTTLLELRDALHPDSLRVAEIDRALRESTMAVDLELPRDEMLLTMHGARDVLAPALACVNGSTAPTMFAFGHGHLDVAWLWPLAETERKAARTLANQLALVEQYPGYSFLHSQAHLFGMVSRRYPALYERVKQAVADGGVIAEGGMWVESDTNVPSGESLVRQFMHGKRYFRQEFGVESVLMWLPDVFGYSGALPQIMAGCGIKYFSTQKIFWNYKGGQPFPHNTFTWQGIDGSEVLVHLHNDYNSQMGPSAVIDRWRQRVQKDGISSRMMPFGHGDGGGGPTRQHLEFALRQKDLEGSPKVRLAGPVEFFEDLERRGAGDLRYVGELYFQCHRGTYTSQAKTKRGNRKSELALREAEMWSAVAGARAGFAFPAYEMENAWKQVLLHQFHDILPGSSIERVYVEAAAAYAEVISAADATAATAREALTDESQALTIFNSLSWNRTALVELPQGAGAAVDAGGENVCVQDVAGATLAEVTVPACGWTTITPVERPDCCGADCGLKLIATPETLENELIRVTFNSRGEIESIYDKAASRELAAGPCNVMKMYKDIPAYYDAWDIDINYMDQPVALDDEATIEAVAAGGLLAVLRITRKLKNSTMTQTVTLRRNSRCLDFHTVIDWQDRHRILKVAFEVDYHADEAVHEIQFGHVKRPNHYSNQFDLDRYEVSNHKWSALVEPGRGFAVLNDCKYGLNVLGKSINLTLLKGPMAPDGNADRGRQEFTYSFLAWDGPFVDSPVVREAYELNCPVTTATGAAGSQSMLSVDAPSVVIDTVKPAEDAGGDIVVRLYESKGAAARAALTVALPATSASVCDMLENRLADAPLADGAIALDFRPFEVKTLRLVVDKSQ